MDWKEIDRLRDPGFTIARRGYDRREVDKFLGSLVDWLETDAVRELEDQAVRRKLEFVGKSTSRMLLTAQEESAQLRRLTDEECVQLRSEAEAASHKARRDADQYAKQTRAKTEQDARRTAEVARAAAQQIVEEGQRRLAEIEAVVSELEARRDGTIRELDRLRADLSSTIGTHDSDAHQRNSHGPDEKSQPDTVAKT
jgi:DivIVA domain-containing protein